MKDTALILTNGRLATADAKTAHGLIRGTERFTIVGVIDPLSCGKDAGDIVDGRFRNIPVFESVRHLSGSFPTKTGLRHHRGGFERRQAARGLERYPPGGPGKPNQHYQYHAPIIE